MIVDPEGHEPAALDALAPDLIGARVLEIGCGNGRLTRRYARRTGSVLAIDPDADAIAAFERDRPANVTVAAVGVDQLSSPPASFDLVLLSWAL